MKNILKIVVVAAIFVITLFAYFFINSGEDYEIEVVENLAVEISNNDIKNENLIDEFIQNTQKRKI